MQSSSSDTIEFEHKGTIIKFESGESTSHDFCTTSCIRKGRSHFHFIECKGGEECMEKENPEKAKHSD